MPRRPQPLANPELELQARQLADQLLASQEQRFLEIARLLVSSSPRELFSTADFELREHTLQIGADCLQRHLAQKKTVMSAPESTAPSAGNPPSSKDTGPGG